MTSSTPRPAASRRRRVGLLAVAVALLTTSLAGWLTVPAGADPSDPPKPADPSTLEDVAEQTLETVEDLLENAPDLNAGGSPAPGGKPSAASSKNDLTLALLDLATNADNLPKGKRGAAKQLLARPTDSSASCDTRDDLNCYAREATERRYCNSVLCIHWVSKADDPVNGVPSDNNGDAGGYPGELSNVPDYVEYALSQATRVAKKYTAAGYRPIPGDGTAGGNALPDIYLQEVADNGAYGYCVPDEVPSSEHIAAASFCVLDNDYSEFGVPPRDALRVTAAHELFHAVQFGYDVSEDRWLMEATATWIEDEVFDSINDNRDYLAYGPLRRPHQSLDLFSDAYGDLPPYGTWIFFRYLSERFPGSSGGLPTIVRDIWDHAVNTDDNPDTQYSVWAVRRTLADRKATLPGQLTRFQLWNRRPATFYEEGSAYATAPTRGTFRLKSSARSDEARFRLDHLSASTYRFTKTSGTRGGYNLDLRINANSDPVGGRAALTIKAKGKSARVVDVALNEHGNRVMDLRFGNQIEWIDVTVVNTSVRYRGCGDPDRTSVETCQGFSLDDDLLQVVKGRMYLR